MDLLHCLALLAAINGISGVALPNSEHLGRVEQTPEFRFSNIYGDHMVLQQAPHQANVWGYTSDCKDKVTMMFNQHTYPASLIMSSGEGCKWRVTLPPTKADTQKAYTITARSQKHGAISIDDVVFGDVWLCSGQSNMVFPLAHVNDAEAEVAKAADYPMIRLFTAALEQSTTPLDELIEVSEPWSVAGPKSVNGTGYFSAVCWLFGRNLFNYLNYPIGLISTDWGGTPVEAWSSPDVLKTCGIQSQEQTLKYTGPHVQGPGDHSVLWNAMIHPFLKMTIKGGLWYQGEANSRAPETYNCTFSAMIDDWRGKWYNYTMQQTDPLFPFGFVQLAADGTSNTTVGGFQEIRWGQTANMGYVPNDRLKNVFMAVAMDLGDPTSPYGSVHPRDKQDVAARLVLSARAVAYKDAAVDFQGPLALNANIRKMRGPIEVLIQYKNEKPLELRYSYGFEVGCGTNSSKTLPSQWIEGTAMQVVDEGLLVAFADCPSSTSPEYIRYCWRTDPCTFKKCPVYAGELPSPPFILKLGK